MNRHHPSDETLAAFAAGTLDLGRRLVVASHLEQCAHCRRTASDFEQVAGALLEDLSPAPLAEDALAHMMARLDVASDDPGSPLPSAEDEPGLPACLRPYQRGRWRWAGPGLQFRSIVLPEVSGARLFMLKAEPGKRLPEHTHTGTELTAILTGAYAHEGGRFAAGDFEEADDDVEHRPVVEADGECVCLVALEGQLKLSGVMGALLNPFLRF